MILEELLRELVRDVRLVEANSQEQWTLSAVMGLQESHNELVIRLADTLRLT